jgi:hypothetical protein
MEGFAHTGFATFAIFAVKSFSWPPKSTLAGAYIFAEIARI